MRTRLTAPDLTPPSWDPFGTVWSASRTSKGSAVWAVRPGDEAPRRVEAPELDGQRVVALRVARDGVRVVVVVGDAARAVGACWSGAIERTADTLELGGLRRVESSLVDVADVAWADADRMAVLGQEPNGVLQPLLVEADGTVTRASGSLSDPVRIAAAPGRPLVAATDGRHALARHRRRLAGRRQGRRTPRTRADRPLSPSRRVGSVHTGVDRPVRPHPPSPSGRADADRSACSDGSGRRGRSAVVTDVVEALLDLVVPAVLRRAAACRR